MSSEPTDKKKSWDRRTVVTNLASAGLGGIGGWVLGSSMDVFRRPLAERIGESRFGRNPDMNIVPVEETLNDEGDFTLTIANTGGETAEELAINTTFAREIIDYTVIPQVNTPPYPEINIELREDGGADVWIGGLPRAFEKATPIVIEFVLGEGDTWATSRIQEADSNSDRDIVMYLNARVSWTFIGERAYDDPEGVFVPSTPHLP